MLEIKNITKRYQKGSEAFTALDNVSLRIKKGDFMAVTGASGAGKSTLLNAIGGLIHPDSGEVLFNGKDIYKQKSKVTDEYRKNHIGFMFQQFHLMPYLTVLDNIRLACYEKHQLDSINNYLERCSLAGLKNKYPSELSVGEKQRTAFIRAIISTPAILLADEPTGNLDPVNSSILMVLVEDYHKNGGTVVLVSHDPLVAKYANRNITLEMGKILSS
ncbi:MAG: ABC transporter ATP-binding protein [Bacteroidia bacterium]|nr:ABC transporter ATP-binding protein [Bacteroidia bacterium]